MNSEIFKNLENDSINEIFSSPYIDQSNYTVDENESLGLFEKTSTDEIKEYLNEQPEMVENNN